MRRAARPARRRARPRRAARLGEHLSAGDDDAHAAIVARDALYRRMIDAAGQLVRVAYEAGPGQAAGSSSPTRCCSPATRTAAAPASPRPQRIPVHTRTARRRRSATALRLRRTPYQAARPDRTPDDHLAALRQRTGRRRSGNPLLRDGYPAPERTPHDHLAPPAATPATPARARPRRAVPAGRTPHDHLTPLHQRTGRRRSGNPFLRTGYPARAHAP